MSLPRIAPTAQLEIEEIVDFIALENPDAAVRVRDAIFQAIRRIGERPLLGHTRPDLTSRPLRFWNAMRRYTIIYQIDGQQVAVLRVFGPGRDIKRRLR